MESSKKDLNEEMTFRLKVKEMNEPTMQNIWGTHDKKNKQKQLFIGQHEDYRLGQ